MGIIVLGNKVYESSNGKLKFLYEEESNEIESMDFPSRTCSGTQSITTREIIKGHGQELAGIDKGFI